MRRLINPFVVLFTLLVALIYAYAAWSTTAAGSLGRSLLLVPFLLIWLVPILYWVLELRRDTRLQDTIQLGSYMSMAWVNFYVLLALLRDGLSLLATSLNQTRWLPVLTDPGNEIILDGSFVALFFGVWSAYRGPQIRHVKIAFPNLDSALVGLRIVQISDLHAGLTIGKRYVQKVVYTANTLNADIIALTGDLLDGGVAKIKSLVAPLGQLTPLRRSYVVLGNHEYYSGSEPWIAEFRALGLKTLLNENEIIDHHGVSMLIGGVLDPAAVRFNPQQEPRPDLAARITPTMPRDNAPRFRLLLAHNPKIAPLAAKAGFDLQLSGHTHAGQFFPWNLVVKMVHRPHVAGLSRQGDMLVYVSSGTGSWGPPIRFGTKTELTLLELVRAT
ncbi:MAG: metallophosphoesterase [Oligoflexales bacterium]